jgi:alkylation response protein AidB-like acyl-CoA dehydrogenase
MHGAGRAVATRCRSSSWTRHLSRGAVDEDPAGKRVSRCELMGAVLASQVDSMLKGAEITQIYEGTNQIQRMVMARQLLK